jgi:hypothetical protein
MFFVGVATMKINKSKLKDMVQKGVPVVPVKRKRTDDGPSSAPPAPSVRPSKTIPLVQASTSLPPSPPIVQILDEEIPFVPLTDDGPTICQSLGLASKRAEAAITDLDFQEYANAQTEEISKLMVHSLMRVSDMTALLAIFFFFFLLVHSFITVVERGDGGQSSLSYCGG